MSMLNIAKRFKNRKLTEAKADTQQLVDFAGLDLANRFLAIKGRLKAPESDLYYWVKNKTADELEQAVAAAEKAKASKRLAKSKADAGATLVAASNDWEVYHITTFEASQKYGRDTKWCITGINDYGDKYWNQYTKQGVSFYFFITKNDYNPRGVDSKFALVIYPENRYEVFDQQDSPAYLTDIKNIDDISIPGIDLNSMQSMRDIYFCYECDRALSEDEFLMGCDEEFYCEDCFYEKFFFCNNCDEVRYIYNSITLADDSMICTQCFIAGDYAYCEQCDEVYPGYALIQNAYGDNTCRDCWNDYIKSKNGCVDRLINMVKLDSILAGVEEDTEAEVHEIVNVWREAKNHNRISKYSKSEIAEFEKQFIELAAQEGIIIDPASFNEEVAENLKLKEGLNFASEFKLYEGLWN